jgi:hypothetical protein
MKGDKTALIIIRETHLISPNLGSVVHVDHSYRQSDGGREITRLLELGMFHCQQYLTISPPLSASLTIALARLRASLHTPAISYQEDKQ